MALRPDYGRTDSGTQALKFAGGRSLETLAQLERVRAFQLAHGSGKRTCGAGRPGQDASAENRMKYYATRDLERAGVVADGIDQLIPVLEALEEMKTISVEDHDRCLNKMIDQMWDDLLKRNPKADREEAVQMTNLMRL